MSKMIAFVSLSASRNGFTSSQFAPMPLNRRRGGRDSSPRFTATMSCWSPTSVIRASMSPDLPAATSIPMADLSFNDIAPGSRHENGMTLVARRFRRLDLIARTTGEPVAPIEPPAALPLLRARLEGVRVGRACGADHIGRLLVGRRIEKALQVPAVREHEGRVVPENTRGLEDRFPGRDVIGEAGHDIGVDLAPCATHVDSLSVQGELAGVDEGIGEIKVDKVAVETGRQPGRIGVPVKDVEGRRRVAEQVVVDPVVPDQVVRPHPGEHAGQVLSVEYAPQLRRLLGGDHRAEPLADAFAELNSPT